METSKSNAAKVSETNVEALKETLKTSTSKAVKEAKESIKVQESKKVKVQVAKKEKEKKAAVPTFDEVMEPVVSKTVKLRKNMNREAYKTLKIMKVAIAKGAFNPDTDYKVILADFSKARKVGTKLGKQATAKSASTPKVVSKDKPADKTTSKTKQSTKENKSAPKKEAAKPKYNRWDSAAEAIKSKKNYKSIEELAKKADEMYVKQTGKNSNLKESKAVVQVAVKLVAHFDVVVKIEK